MLSCSQGKRKIKKKNKFTPNLSKNYKWTGFGHSLEWSVEWVPATEETLTQLMLQVLSTNFTHICLSFMWLSCVAMSVLQVPCVPEWRTKEFMGNHFSGFQKRTVNEEMKCSLVSPFFFSEQNT